MGMYCNFGIILLFNTYSPIYPELLKVQVHHPIITRFIHGPNTVNVGYNVMKGTEYSVLLYATVVLSNKNIVVNSEELIGTTVYLTQ